MNIVNNVNLRNVTNNFIKIQFVLALQTEASQKWTAASQLLLLHAKVLAVKFSEKPNFDAV